jgi:hypothetical protein
MKLTDKVDSEFERVLVFGGPKSGKTLLAGNLAEEFDLLYFDLENGYKTLRRLSPFWQERINLISLPDTKVFPIAIETMLKVITGAPMTVCHLHGKVNCLTCKKDGLGVEQLELNALGPKSIVVIDSGTQLATSAMAHIKKNDDELEKASWDDYFRQGYLMDKFLSQCQHAKFNLCFITHEVEAELENGGKKLVPVAGTREFSRNTAKYFDHVVYCELKNKKHAFGSATDYSMSVLTGSRADIAIEKLDKPSLLPFFRHEVKKQPAQQKPILVMPSAASPIPVEQAQTNKTVEVGRDVTPTAPVDLPKPDHTETMAEKLARLRLARGGVVK